VNIKVNEVCKIAKNTFGKAVYSVYLVMCERNKLSDTTNI